LPTLGGSSRVYQSRGTSFNFSFALNPTNIEILWVTATGSNKLSCLPESAKLVRNVVAESAGITTEGPMPVMGGGEAGLAPASVERENPI